MASNAFPEKHLVFLSPHYDDIPLTFGGLLRKMRKLGGLKAKKVTLVLIFSRSNYQARDEEGNRDLSAGRVRFASGVRLREDRRCLNVLLGTGRYAYRRLGERECVLRQKGWKPGEKFEFPFGNRSTYDQNDWAIYRRLRRRARGWLEKKNTALFVPLGIKEQIDHSLVRDAVADQKRAMGGAARATVYFGEEQPYTGLATRKDWGVTRRFMRPLKLRSMDFKIDAAAKAKLVMTHYTSQVEESYREGVLRRARQLKGAERVYRWE